MKKHVILSLFGLAAMILMALPTQETILGKGHVVGDQVQVCHQGWQRDFSGHWKVYIARAAAYDFLLRFDPGPEPGSARLRIGDTERVQQIGAGTATCTFSGVELLQGETDIEAVLQHGRSYEEFINWKCIRNKPALNS